MARRRFSSASSKTATTSTTKTSVRDFARLRQRRRRRPRRQQQTELPQPTAVSERGPQKQVTGSSMLSLVKDNVGNTLKLCQPAAAPSHYVNVGGGSSGRLAFSDFSTRGAGCSTADFRRRVPRLKITSEEKVRMERYSGVVRNRLASNRSFGPPFWSGNDSAVVSRDVSVGGLNVIESARVKQTVVLQRVRLEANQRMNKRARARTSTQSVFHPQFADQTHNSREP